MDKPENIFAVICATLVTLHDYNEAAPRGLLLRAWREIEKLSPEACDQIESTLSKRGWVELRGDEIALTELGRQIAIRLKTWQGSRR